MPEISTNVDYERTEATVCYRRYASHGRAAGRRSIANNAPLFYSISRYVHKFIRRFTLNTYISLHGYGLTFHFASDGVMISAPLISRRRQYHARGRRLDNAARL